MGGKKLGRKLNHRARRVIEVLYEFYVSVVYVNVFNTFSPLPFTLSVRVSPFLTLLCKISRCLSFPQRGSFTLLYSPLPCCASIDWITARKKNPGQTTRGEEIKRSQRGWKGSKSKLGEVNGGLERTEERKKKGGRAVSQLSTLPTRRLTYRFLPSSLPCNHPFPCICHLSSFNKFPLT